ncbi:MAG: putative ABC exporter domain-containing protein [Cyclobacteriaceae bacterium]
MSWGLVILFPFCLMTFYFTGFSISLTSQIGFEEGWDRKLIKPLIVGGVLIFGILPSLGLGITAYAISRQFVYALMAVSIGMSLVTGAMLNLTVDIIRKIELKELG